MTVANETVGRAARAPESLAPSRPAVGVTTARREGASDSAGAPPRARRAFTLVELVAATALSAVLLTAVLSVVRALNRRPPPDGYVDVAAPLAAQLRWDLANAVVLRTGPAGLTLAGYGSLDPDTMGPTRQPTQVTYALQTVGDRVWLVRRQQALDARAEGGTSAELVCGDVAGFTVDAPPTAADRQAATRPADEDPTPLAFAALAGTRPVPPRVRVSVTFATPGRPVVDVVAYR